MHTGRDSAVVGPCSGSTQLIPRRDVGLEWSPYCCYSLQLVSPATGTVSACLLLGFGLAEVIW